MKYELGWRHVPKSHAFCMRDWILASDTLLSMAVIG